MPRSQKMWQNLFWNISAKDDIEVLQQWVRINRLIQFDKTRIFVGNGSEKFRGFSMLKTSKNVNINNPEKKLRSNVNEYIRRNSISLR